MLILVVKGEEEVSIALEQMFFAALGGAVFIVSLLISIGAGLLT